MLRVAARAGVWPRAAPRTASAVSTGPHETLEKPDQKHSDLISRFLVVGLSLNLFIVLQFFGPEGGAFGVEIFRMLRMAACADFWP